MPAVADYRTASDDQFSLFIGGDTDHDLVVSIPATANLNANAILAFMLDPVAPSALAFDVAINGTTLLNMTIGTEATRSIHENFSGSILVAGDNTLTFRVLSGTGTLKFSDVFLYFKVLV